MSASAGRVLLIPKGTYDSSTTYAPMDIVKYGVSSYVCKLESTGNVPTNTTYWQILAEGIANVSPEAIGIGYGVSSDSGSARTATLADYNLTPNGIVAVSFGADVPANATLNINSQGAKPIYYRGSALVANVIRGGDTVTFAYDGTHYDILCIDGGAGHEIENSAGTKLSQRDVLQFNNGLEATDDSTNQKTKVGLKTDYISLADWNAMSSAEQEEYKASHYRFGIELPDTEGVINAEYMKLLWENPNTTQAFAEQAVTLSSADCDFVLWIYHFNTGIAYEGSAIAKKGENAIMSFGDSGHTYFRAITATSNTVYTINNATNNGTTDNTYIIPIAAYGIKGSFQFKVNAIASELSTRADHCFLDDEVTPITDYINNYSTTEHVIGKWIDGSTLYEKTVDFGALPNATTKSVAHGISNINKIVSISAVATRSSDGTAIAIPNAYPSTNYITEGAYIDIQNTNIRITTGANKTAFDNTYVTLRYTKTA